MSVSGLEPNHYTVESFDTSQTAYHIFAMAYSGFYGKADIVGVTGSRSGRRMICSSSDNLSLEG
jgi:hypothetical protein